MTEVKQDWPTGRSSEMAARQASNSPMAGVGQGDHEGHQMTGSLQHIDYSPLDRLVPVVAAEHLAPPVLISPPNLKNPNWSAKSDSQNRTLRANLKLDAVSGAVVERKDFAQRPLIDRIVGIGVAAHEGQLFGWFNQLLGLFTTVGVFLVAISAAVLWWRRRLPGKLGALKVVDSKPVPLFLWMIVILLGMFLPLMGVSLIAIFIIEFCVLRRIPTLRDFLGIG